MKQGTISSLPIRYPGDIKVEDLRNPVVAKIAYSLTYEKLIEARTAKEALKKQNMRFKSKIEHLETDLKTVQKQLSKVTVGAQSLQVKYIVHYVINYLFDLIVNNFDLKC